MCVVVSSHDGVIWGTLACWGVFAGFFVFLLGVRWVWSPPQVLLSVLLHTRTEVCCKCAKHTKMLVFYLNIKARMITNQ